MPSAPSTPTLLRIGQPLALVGAVIAALIAITIIRGSPYDTSALESMSPYGLWFMRVLLALTLCSAIALFFVYRGLKRRQSWARPLIVAFWVFCQAGALLVTALQRPAEGTWSADLTPLIFLVASIAYLYFKPNVTAYFAAAQKPKEAASVA